MTTHNYYISSGISISGIFKITYEQGESITFNENYLGALGFSKTSVWNFYESATRTLIKTINGNGASTTFTHAEGKNGIDVELILTFGINQTRFYKRHRIVLMPDCSTPTFTINLSDGIADPFINDGGGGQHEIDFSSCTGGEIVRLMGTLSSVRVKCVNLPNSTSNPVILVVNSTTAFNKNNTLTLSGTSGTANIRIRGVNYLATFNTSLTITASDFVTAHAAAILADTGCTVTSSGGTLLVTGASFTVLALTGNLGGTNTFDELFRIDDGDPTNGLWIYGKKDGSGNRYFSLNGGGIACFRTSNINSHNNIRVSGVRVSNAQSTAIKLKLDNVNRFNDAMADCWIYDVDGDFSTNEFCYCGWEAASGYKFDATFNGGDYHHTLKRLKIFANYVHNSGWDGVQCTGADEDTEIHDNLITGCGSEGTFAQWFGISCGSGFAGHIYNNIIDDAIQVFVNKTTHIFNNIIRGNTNASINNAIFVRRTDNPGSVGPNADSYNHCDPLGELHIFGNLILSVLDPLYILDANDGLTGTVPLNVIRYFNNTLYYSGTPAEGNMRYAEPGTTTVMQAPNFLVTLVENLKINDLDAFDVQAKDNSEIFNPGNEGADVSLYITESTLKVGYTDLSGQSYPLQGRWRMYPIQRYSGYKVPDPSKTQIQFYKTNQVSVFSDKEKLNDMYGTPVKTYSAITGSAKPKLLASVRPIALTGTINGAETFDDTAS